MNQIASNFVLKFDHILYSLSNPNLTPIFESEPNVVLCINGHVIHQAEPKLI